jgi:O-antigen/teichoic acid export membrane protein
MFDKIRQLGSDTAVYGVSTILGRFLTFILTPIYTHILRPDDLGIVATVYAYIAVMNVVYGYGMESAYMKYSSTLELGSRKQVFSVPFFSVAITSFLFSLVLFLLRAPVAEITAIPEGYGSLVSYSAAILFLDGIAVVPFASLRMAHKAKLFASIKMAGITINVAANLILLFGLRMGVEGIFISNVISSGATLLMLLPSILRQLEFSWKGELYRSLLTFGLPYVPAGLASMMIQVINRPILEALKDRSAVGIFQANYRLGIFMMLIVSMYDFAWRPFFLSHAADPDAKKLFARILTYFVLIGTGIFLLLSFFLEDLVRVPIFWGHPMVAAPYWSGLNIVPTVLLAYLFLGIYNNLIAGIYIEKKTQYLPLVTITGAVVNIAALYLLIPRYDLMGAAVATLVSYLVMAAMLYFIVQRFYYVPYEFGRIAKIAVAAAAVYILYLTVPVETVRIAWKCVLLAFFFLLMYLLKFFDPAEMKILKRLFRRGPKEVSPLTDKPDETA